MVRGDCHSKKKKKRGGGGGRGGDFHVRMSRVRNAAIWTGFFFSQWVLRTQKLHSQWGTSDAEIALAVGTSDAEIALAVGYFGRRNCTRSGVLRTQKLHVFVLSGKICERIFFKKSPHPASLLQGDRQRDVLWWSHFDVCRFGLHSSYIVGPY